MARRTGSSAEVTGPRIRAAALRLFARHGYAAVSMRQIATEVGLQAGALYLYTPDKQTLLFDLLRGHMEDLLAAYRVPEGPPEARLRQFVRFHIGYNLDHADEVFLSYMELRNLEPANFAAIESLRRRYEDRLSAILGDGVGQGAFQITDVRLATMAVIAMLNGVNTWYRQSGRLSRDEVLAIHETMAKGMIGAR
ncbi:TetR/AcrR family transcriptional regulator [Frigidibacter sp. SD6-1]|uniref:TetR/AcrR family transcriptional regulator n=1 Tax=Frigidibacter sp. SD6-1 TaxID=3032581 RepID=UPI0024DF3BD1|nr:TetR/AcrR family transcriptional regulator [Frigidibacter sp. SD6-1]